MSGQQSVFGAGYLWGTTVGGSPRLFACLQNVTVDFSQDLKGLWGNQQYAIEQGSGKAKITAKADIGRFDPHVVNDLYFGGTMSGGSTAAGTMEAHTVPASSAYTVTATHSATEVNDLGVYDVTQSGFLGSAGSPASGVYSYSSGVYSFNSANASDAVQISYTYTTSGGFTMKSGNPVIGSKRQIFRADLFNSYDGIPSGITLFACQTSKLGMPFKQDDWLLTSFDFEAQDDGAGNVVALYGTGASPS